MNLEEIAKKVEAKVCAVNCNGETSMLVNINELVPSVRYLTRVQLYLSGYFYAKGFTISYRRWSNSNPNDEVLDMKLEWHRMKEAGPS